MTAGIGRSRFLAFGVLHFTIPKAVGQVTGFNQAKQVPLLVQVPELLELPQSPLFSQVTVLVLLQVLPPSPFVHFSLVEGSCIPPFNEPNPPFNLPLSDSFILLTIVWIDFFI